MKRKKKIFLITGICVGTLLLLCVIALLLVSSSSFITSVVLPGVSSAMNCDITAGSVDVSLFSSSVKIKNAKVAKGKREFLKAGSIDLDSSISALIAGKLTVDKLDIQDVQLNLEQDSDGKFFIPFGGKDEKSKPSAPAVKEKKSSSAAGKSTGTENLDYDLKNLNLKNLCVNISLAKGVDGKATTLKYENVNLAIDRLAPGYKTKILLNTDASAKASNISIERSKVSLAGTCKLNAQFMPDDLNMILKSADTRGVVNGNDISGNELTILVNSSFKGNCIELEKLLFRQILNGKVSSKASITAQIGLSPLAVKADIDIDEISEDVLAMLCRIGGNFNPGHSTLSYNGKFDLAGKDIASFGTLTVNHAQSKTAGIMVPAFIFKVDHDFSVNIDQQHLTAKKLDVLLLENSQREVIRLKLAKAFSWSKTDSGSKLEAALRINDLDQSYIKPFIASDGNFQLNTVSINAAIDFNLTPSDMLLTSNGNVNVDKLDFKSGKYHSSAMALKNSFNAVIKEKFSQFSLEQLNVQLLNAENKALDGSFHATFDAKTKQIHAVCKYLVLKPHFIDILDADLRKSIAPLTVKCTAEASFDAAKGLLTVSKDAAVEMAYGDQKQLAASLLEDFSMQSGNAKVRLKISDFDLANLKELCKVDKVRGQLDSDMLIISSEKFKALEVTGSLIVTSPGFDNCQFGQLSSDFKCALADFKKVDIEHFNLKIAEGNPQKDAMFVQMTASADPEQGKLDANGQIRFDSVLIKKLGSSPLQSGDFNGSFKVAVDKLFSNFDINSKLTITNLRSEGVSGAMNGGLSLQMHKDKNSFKCSDSVLTLNSGKQQLVHLACSADVPFPLKRSKSKAKIVSNQLDLKLLQQLLGGGRKEVKKQTASSQRPEKTARPAKSAKPQKEPVLDMKGLDMEATVDFNNITYTSDMRSSIHANIRAKDNNILVKPLNVKINDGSGSYALAVYGRKDIIAYSLSGGGKHLKIGPVLKSLSPKGDKISGMIDDVNINIAGSGVYEPTLGDNLEGTADCKLSNLKLPLDFDDSGFFKMILLPVNVMVNLQNQMSDNAFTKPLKKFFGTISDITQDNYILFHSVDIGMNAGDSRFAIIRGELKGEALLNIKLYGYSGMGSKNELYLNTATDVGGALIIPVIIRGTVEKPQVSYRKIITSLLADNTINILKSTGKIGDKVGDDVLNGAKKILDNPLDDSDGAGKNIKQGVKEIIKIFN